ncbi:hypothetical protein Tsubulata_005900 [Turnera subulata]|uniref:Glycosyltransferase family 92 protein n=1 Tax=Turnera subulata TaxID=218843 RepID=A0A9Q0G717_9ROSI|nr:hypothetical protein Tsubulata_005900 [Turnera subulata]
MGILKERERTGEKKLLVGIRMNCGAELKLLLTTLVVLCSVASLLQFIPSRFAISTSDLRFCISKITTTTTTQTTTTTIAPQQNPLLNSSTLSLSVTPHPDPLPPPPPPPPGEQVDANGIIKRVFNPSGYAAYNFITMGAYRGGLDTFAVIGISSKPIHLYAKPTYECEWVMNSNPNPNSTAKPNTTSITTAGYKILPDWGYGRVYTVVVVNCTFPQPINANNSGGKLLLHASTAGGFDKSLNVIDTFEVLTELPGKLDTSLFSSKPKYDYFYCGSSLYGGLSPQRVREWIAYHVRLFGEKSHFVIHDAGGVHEEVLEVLKPWMELGYVTVQDIRDQERFDGYYHNQFMVVNDCLHRYRFMAKWMFFFDVDEYIYVPPKNTIKSVLDSLSNFNQFTIEQMPMNSKLCLSADYGRYYRKWGFEKLVYRDTKRGIRRDRKYAIQPRSVYATGVHMSQNLAGKTTHKTEGKIKYFHYHGTIAQRREPCRTLLNVSEINFENNPYVLDTTMRDIGWSVRKFEDRMIGSRLKNTRQ